MQPQIAFITVQSVTLSVDASGDQIAIIVASLPYIVGNGTPGISLTMTVQVIEGVILPTVGQLLQAEIYPA